jgi:hypothetical protein
VLKVALPALTAPVPSVVDPSKNVTVPVGAPLAVVTVAVNVTLAPGVEGVCEVARLVDVVAFEAAFTT